MGVLTVTSLLVVVLDQLSKIAALRMLHKREIRISSHVRLSLVMNVRGGMLALTTRQAVLISTVCAIVLLAWLGIAQDPGAGTLMGGGLVLGGAASNLADRFRRGLIVDFVRVWGWPTFNLADAALCCGAALSVAGFWWR